MSPEKVTPAMQAALPQRRPTGLHAALGFFTAVPVPAFGVVDRIVAARAIRWFWAVGALVGGASGAVAVGALTAGLGPALAAALSLAVLGLATGAIHLDGVADTADGLGSRRPPDEALEIMRKPDVGPMGVATLVLVLLVEWAALTQLAGRGWGWLLLASVAGPAIGRLALLAATSPGVAMARRSGFGALFGGVTPRWLVWVGYGVGLAVMAAAGWWWRGAAGGLTAAAAVVVPLLVAALWRRHLTRRLGGMTGDTFGSIVELTQLSCWIMLALAR